MAQSRIPFGNGRGGRSAPEDARSLAAPLASAARDSAVLADKHDIRLDMVRVAAAMAVVWLHVSADIVIARPSTTDPTWWIGNFADSLSRWCVPLFVMASGILLLSRRPDLAPRAFYRRRAAKILVPTLFWTALYVALRIAGRGESLSAIFESLLQGRPFFHLWYLYMILGLYLVAPMVSVFLAHGARPLVNGALVLAFLAAAIQSTIAGLESEPDSQSFLGLWPYYLGYFLAGYQMWRTPVTALRNRYALAIALASGILVALLTGFLLGSLGERSWAITYSYSDPLVVLMSLALFNVFRCLNFESPSLRRIGETARRLAPLMLGVYVMHPLWLIALGHAGLDGFFVSPAIGIPLTAASAFVLSLASARVFAAIPFLRKTI
jgi:surface polysaccharide O-acyltransferase-like enzyme